MLLASLNGPLVTPATTGTVRISRPLTAATSGPATPIVTGDAKKEPVPLPGQPYVTTGTVSFTKAKPESKVVDKPPLTNASRSGDRTWLPTCNSSGIEAVGGKEIRGVEVITRSDGQTIVEIRLPITSDMGHLPDRLLAIPEIASGRCRPQFIME